MEENQSVEQRLDTIERLLRGQKSVLTFEEGCEFTGLSKSYMYKLTHRNKIPYFKPHGKNIYFSREELEKWLLKNPVKTAEAVEQEAANYATLGRGRK
jgi:excisionase family DNA binding protein